MMVITADEVESPFLHSTGPALSRFLTALRDEGVIWGRRCRPCDRVVVPANDYCETCAAELSDWVRVGPEGTVSGLTVVSQPMPLAPLAPRFAFVRVRLDGADTDLIHVAKDASALRRGARVRAVFAEQRTGSILDLLGFAPADQPSPSPPAGAGAGEPVTVVRTHLRLPFRHSHGAVLSRFSEGLRRGEIGGNRCVSCARLYVPPRDVCARCFGPCQGWQRVPDTGTVVTFVVVNVPFYGQEIAIPYVLAHIQLDGADTTFYHLVGSKDRQGKLSVPVGGARLGMRVRAAWRDPAQRRGLLNDDIDHFEPEGT